MIVWRSDKSKGHGRVFFHALNGVNIVPVPEGDQLKYLLSSPSNAFPCLASSLAIS